MERLRDIALLIRNVLQEYGFRTREMNYQYPITSRENAILKAIEGIIFFDNRSGYIFMSGRDGMEYVSGNDSNLAIKWDGTRPNVNFNKIPGFDNNRYLDITNQYLDQAGGYIRYIWKDPAQVAAMDVIQQNYIIPYDEYLYIGTVYRVGPSNPNVQSGILYVEEDLGDRSRAYVMVGAISQLIGNFLMNNIYKQDRYKEFLQAVARAVPNMFMLNKDGTYIIQNGHHIPVREVLSLIQEEGGGYIKKCTWNSCSVTVAKVPYTEYIVGYADKNDH